MSASSPRRALAVSLTTTVVDSDPVAYVATPAGSLDSGIGHLLDRVAGRFDREGVLLLDRSAAAAVGLPTGEIPAAGMPDHPAIARAAEAGWKAHTLSNWTTFYQGDGASERLVIVGLTWMLDVDRFPLLADWIGDTVAALRQWHELVGAAYLMTPGVAGTRVLQRMNPMRPGKPAIKWKTPYTGPADADEAVMKPHHWRRADVGAYEHSYDARRAGLASAINANVCRWGLKPSGKTGWKGKVGWVHAELSPWNVPEMPHPAGPDAATAVGPMWISTATVDLLAELTEEGKYGGIVNVWDSFTGQRSRLFREWGEHMDRAYLRAQALTNERDDQGEPTVRALDADRVADAIKQAAARETVGMFNAGSGAIQRPDWHHIVNATKRCNMWRRAWRIGKATGRWPVQFDDDKVWYASDLPDAEKACPDGMVLGNGLGEFRTDETREAGK